MSQSHIISFYLQCTNATPQAIIEYPEAGSRLDGSHITLKPRILQGDWSEVKNILYEARPVGMSAFTPIQSITGEENPTNLEHFMLHWDVSALANGDYEIRAITTDILNNVDPHAPIVRITKDDQQPLIHEYQSTGDHYARFKTYRGCQNKLMTAFERDQNLFGITLPELSIADYDDVVQIQDNDPALFKKKTILGNLAGGMTMKYTAVQLIPADIYRTINTDSGLDIFDSMVKVSFYYQDKDNDYILDGTTIPVNQLEVFLNDQKSDQWIIQNYNKILDPQAKILTIMTVHTGLFGLFTFPKPKPVIDLMVTELNTEDVLLQWSAVNQSELNEAVTIDHYNIYAADSVDFIPDLINHSNRIGQSTALSYVDEDALISPSEYYYLVTAVDVNGRESYPR